MSCKTAILITGPTASGKTAIGIQVAQQLPAAEILSVDSRQLYCHLDIGTAKPSPQQRAQVRHHFLDVAEPDTPYSAGRYAREARALIRRLWEEGKTPVLVGGTGLYWQAVFDGICQDEGEYGPVRAWLGERLEREGLGALYAELGKLDPQSQARLNRGDPQRIMRALEVAHASGKSLSRRWAGQGEDALEGWHLMFCLSVERQELYRRIGARVEHMLEQGLVEEVNHLVDIGYGRGTYALGSLGYAEILDYLEGKCSLGEAVARLEQRTRQYAKRQLTWFRRDRRLRWLEVGVWGEEGVVERILEHLQHHLGATGSFLC
jgi:tRNA dimethylallyltransferase